MITYNNLRLAKQKKGGLQVAFPLVCKTVAIIEQ